jgi:hypothetical protein
VTASGIIGDQQTFEIRQRLLTNLEIVNSIPTKSMLCQNYLNPFNPFTIISYQLPLSYYVFLRVYEVQGNEVASFVHEYQQAGIYNSQPCLPLVAMPAGRLSIRNCLHRLFFQITSR